MAEHPHHRAAFPTTRITLVEAACGESGTKAHDALSVLCTAYWYPIYAFVRRLGYAQEDAEDLTQGFFGRFLEKHYLRDFRRDRGRFRSFLLASVKHFIANEHDRSRALKRGGARAALPLEDLFRSAECRYSLEPGHDLTPDKAFDRQWALALLARVEDRLHAESLAAGNEAQFAKLRSCLTPGDSDVSYRELAAELATTEGAIKVAVHRLRQQFRTLLRDEISQTVLDPGDIGSELRYLLAALRP